MAEERADALVQFRADDVFEFAGLRVRFGIVNREGVLEEALREPMAPDHDLDFTGSFTVADFLGEPAA